VVNVIFYKSSLTSHPSRQSLADISPIVPIGSHPRQLMMSSAAAVDYR
jgi:hypothetical protein